MQKSFSELLLVALDLLYGPMVFPVTGCPALILPVGYDEEEGIAHIIPKRIFEGKENELRVLMDLLKQSVLQK